MTAMQHIPDFVAIQAAASRQNYATDPQPGWSGLGMLFGCPDFRIAAAAGAPAADWAVAGVPFDATASSRPGSAEGPRAVREASLVFSSYLNSLGEHQMLDTRTGQTFRYQAPTLADHGDLHTYPTDTVRTFQSVVTAARDVTAASGRAIFLNGDHSCTFPTFAGFRAARMDQGPGRVGFINIDHHFDFGNWSEIHGALYHGSNSRRISELPGVEPADIAFVGVGDVTRHAQFLDLSERGFHLVPASQIVSDGAAAALAPVLESFAQRCSSVYVSLDIDVLDTSVATGTGHVTMGGLQIGHLLDVYEQLRALPVHGLDFAEISPKHDPSGSTPQLAARLLFEFLFRTDIEPATLSPWAKVVAKAGEGLTA